MSTHYDIDHGENHKLHIDIFERGKVYLTLWGQGLEFTARNGAIEVAIPSEIWDRIRQLDAVAKGREIWHFDEDEDEKTDPHSPEKL